MNIVTVNVSKKIIDAMSKLCNDRESNRHKQKSMLQNSSPLQNITINLPDLYIHNFQFLIDKGEIPSRSEGVRQALDYFIKRESAILPLLGLLDEDYEGERELYPSRSELLRVAVKDWMLFKLSNMKSIPSVIVNQPIEETEVEDGSVEFVYVPIKWNDKGEVVETKRFTIKGTACQEIFNIA